MPTITVVVEVQTDQDGLGDVVTAVEEALDAAKIPYLIAAALDGTLSFEATEEGD